MEAEGSDCRKQIGLLCTCVREKNAARIDSGRVATSRDKR
jgi:hypothetical protein